MKKLETFDSIYFLGKRHFEDDGTQNYLAFQTVFSENCLFGAVKLAKRVDVNFYKYSRCGITFDRKGSYSSDDEVGGNVIIFGVHMSWSSHIDNKLKRYLNSW